MKIILFFLITLSVINITLAADVKSKINDVTLYLDGARIKRVSDVSVKKGMNQLVFVRLSPKLDPQTVQIATTENEKILLVSTNQKTLRTTTDGMLLQDLADSIYDIKLRNTIILDEIDALKKEQSLLVNNQEISPNEKITVSELKAMADFVKERNLKINLRKSELNIKLEKNNRRIKQLEQYKTSSSSVTTYEYTEVKVEFKASSTKQSKIELQYVVNSAGWVPNYDLTVTELDKPIHVMYKAQVYNNTKINWNDVPLTLSTGDSRKNALHPNLQAWVISNNEYTKNYEEINYSETGTSTKDGIVYESIEIPALSIDFEITEKYTIPANAKPYLVEIKSMEIDASFKHYTVPKLEETAYLLARVTGWENLDIIEGEANIYFRKKYVGKSYINPNSTSDTLNISLGVDPKIQISRVKTRDFTDNKTLGSNYKDILEFKITVKNLHQTPIEIEVIDQVPISGDDDISIELIESSDAQRNEKTGELSWQKRIEPSGTENIDLGFSIKYPKSLRYSKNATIKKVRAKF